MFTNKVFIRGIVVSKNFKYIQKDSKNLECLFLKIMSTSGDKSNFSFDCTVFGNYAKSLDPLLIPWDKESKQGSQVLVEASFYSISSTEYNGKHYPKVSLSIEQLDILNKAQGTTKVVEATLVDQDIVF